jgi:hypothetical protein
MCFGETFELHPFAVAVIQKHKKRFADLFRVQILCVVSHVHMWVSWILSLCVQYGRHMDF